MAMNARGRVIAGAFRGQGRIRCVHGAGPQQVHSVTSEPDRPSLTDCGSASDWSMGSVAHSMLMCWSSVMVIWFDITPEPYSTPKGPRDQDSGQGCLCCPWESHLDLQRLLFY